MKMLSKIKEDKFKFSRVKKFGYNEKPPTTPRPPAPKASSKSKIIGVNLGWDGEGGLNMDELIKNIKMWRNELERQNAGMGTMMVFDSICSYLGEQERKINQYKNFVENNELDLLMEYKDYFPKN